MKKDLSPEQWSRYQAELDKRLASRKQIAVHYLVEALDRDLYLSDQQRTRLTESLSSQWDDSWYIYLEICPAWQSVLPDGYRPSGGTGLERHAEKGLAGFPESGWLLGIRGNVGSIHE